MWKRIAVAVGFMCAALARPAAADMGRAPVGPPGTMCPSKADIFFRTSTTSPDTASSRHPGGRFRMSASRPTTAGSRAERSATTASSLFGSDGTRRALSALRIDRRRAQRHGASARRHRAQGGRRRSAGHDGRPQGPHVGRAATTWEGGFRLEGDNPVSSTTTVTWVFRSLRPQHGRGHQYRGERLLRR